MRRNIKLICLVLAAIAISVVGVLGPELYKEYQISKNYITLELKHSVENRSDLEDMKNKLEEQGIGIALWSKKEQKMIRNMAYNRSAEVSVIEVYGNTACIYPNNPYMTVGDIKGCLIDSATAYLLFGTENIVGRKIMYEEKVYTIRGVVKATESIFVRMVDGEEDLDYTNLSICKSEDVDRLQVLRVLESGYQLEGRELVAKGRR